MNIRIETDKDAPIHPAYLEPSNQGSDVFVPGEGARTVYLDPEIIMLDGDAQLDPSLLYSSDPFLRDKFGPFFTEAGQVAEATVGNRYCARFYERLLSELLQQQVDIKHITTGVALFTGQPYHDLGYLV